MIKIEGVGWARIIINGKNYWQALIVGKEIIGREVDRVKQVYGTDHLVADWEKKLLLSKNPQVILIANGWSGLLEVDEEFKDQARKRGIELRILRTPKIIDEYHRLVKSGKRVHTLIHTTC